MFDPENKEGMEMRERICHKGLEDVLEWLDNDGGEVAIFDATNTTRERREYLYNRVVVEKGKLRLKAFTTYLYNFIVFCLTLQNLLFGLIDFKVTSYSLSSHCVMTIKSWTATYEKLR